jgi:hypothetical protein
VTCRASNPPAEGRLIAVSIPVALAIGAWWAGPRPVVDATENGDPLHTQWEPWQWEPWLTASIAGACRVDPSLEAGEVGGALTSYETKLIGLLEPVDGYDAEVAREAGILVEKARAIVALVNRELPYSLAHRQAGERYCAAAVLA